MIYTETFRDLCHGTDVDSAKKIRQEGFVPSIAEDNWCGDGIYFYDMKAKAWWAARRKCGQIRQKTGKRINAAVVFADIINIKKEDIFDMRVYKDLCNFEQMISPMLAGRKFCFGGNYDEDERKIRLRAMLISFYANRFNKRLVIGSFQQRFQPLYEHAVEFANGWDMVFGIETIYCVKDSNILENIR